MVNLNKARGINDGVLAEGGGVEEMVDWLIPLFRPEPATAVAGHRALHRVHTKLLAQIGLLRFAVAAVLALSVEDGDHVVPPYHIRHAFPHAFHHTSDHHHHKQPKKKKTESVRC